MKKTLLEAYSLAHYSSALAKIAVTELLDTGSVLYSFQ